MKSIQSSIRWNASSAWKSNTLDLGRRSLGSYANAADMQLVRRDSYAKSEKLSAETIQKEINIMNGYVGQMLNEPKNVIQWANTMFQGNIAMSTSFGIQSAVLLHMATQVKPDIPVVWVDTGYLPKETYLYAQQLTELLGINLKVVSNSEWSPARMEAIYGKLWEKEDHQSHSLYGRLRKVEPLEQALTSLEPSPVALLSGLRSSQTKERANMSPVGIQRSRLKVLPMLNMTDQDVDAYMDKYDLPYHPLQSKGYVTVGDWHSSRPVEAGEDARNTRFGGKFQECGLHVSEEPMADSQDAAQAKDHQANWTQSAKETQVPALRTTRTHPMSNMAVIMVKKITEDGSICRKCNDVANKIESDGVKHLIGNIVMANVREPESDGIKLAKHFDVPTAPFFLVRNSEQEKSNAEWQVVRSYLQLKKSLKEATNV